MEHTGLAEAWDAAHREGVWWTAWSKAVDVTADQAAWKPHPDRHSIWQIVNHLVFWRTYMLERVGGAEQLPGDEIDRRQWAEPDAPTAAAWRETLERFERSHAALREALADDAGPIDRRLRYFLGHDCYHVGQIMYLRALQGLPPVE